MGDRRPARWERSVDEAWREFRRQLADHLAMLEDGEVLELEVQVGTYDEDLDGALPHVQFIGWGEGQYVHSEVSGDHHLDERYRLDLRAEQVLADAGWSAPALEPDGDADAGASGWWADNDLREADLVACRATVALRDAFGCPHPSFVRVDGRLELTGAAAGGGSEPSAAERGAAADEEDDAGPLLPQDADELREMVVAALSTFVGGDVETDEDGDVPLPVGRSVLYVQPVDHEPTVRLWARLVTGVDDLDRAADEVAMMNRDLVFGTVVLTDSGAIDFHHHLCAMPFVPQQLRMVVARVISDLDRRAADFVRRVGGRQFLDDDGSEVGGRTEVPRAVPTELLVLRELLEAGAADPRTVAALWDGDLHALAVQIDELRTEPPAVLDVADAIAVLRDALVFVAERRSRARWLHPTRPPGRRRVSQQDELIPSRELGEATLDLGVE